MAFLKDSILNGLDKTEMASLRKAVVGALDRTGDKQSAAWHSPDSSVNARIAPSLTYTENDRECRRILLRLEKAGHESETYRFNACKGDEGRWALKRTRLQTLIQSDISLLEQGIEEAADSGAEVGVPVTWHNPETRISGTIVVISTFEQDEAPCYKTSVSLIDKDGVALEGRYTFCKTSTGLTRLPGAIPDTTTRSGE